MKCRADFAMLVQLMALLSLGMLCSSAAIPETTLSLQEQRSKAESTIKEILEEIKKLNESTEVPSFPTVNAMMERCMNSSLKTFAKNFEALNLSHKAIAKKLALVTSYESILPEDLDEECPTVQVTEKVFLETLDTFLRLLFEKI